VEVSTQDLIGHVVKINKSDYSQVEGKVVNVSEQKVMLDLTKGVKGVETNVWLTVVDKQGKEHIGSLFVN
jgi:FKBP-type peptidyl-prolyl cis-trans isomerase 2